MANLKALLLDSGPAVALIEQTDPEHRCVPRVLSEFNGRLDPTTAVDSEVMHFVAP